MKNNMKWNGYTPVIVLALGLMLFCLYMLIYGAGTGEDSVTVRNNWKIIRPPHEVSAIVQQGDVIWAGGMDGVQRIDRKEALFAGKLETAVDIEYVKAMLVDRNNILWIGHEGGLAKYDGSKLTNYTQKDGLPDNRVNALALDKSGVLWAGTWKGAVRIGSDKWEVLTAKDGLMNDMVNAILFDNSGGMWFGSYVAPQGGISCKKGDTWLYFNTDNGLPHNNINALYESDSGVWAATGFCELGGACVFHKPENTPGIFQCLNKSTGLAGEKVRSIFQDTERRMWLGSEYDGISVLNGNSINIYTTDDGLSDNEVKCMLQDNEGNIWLGTRDGVTYIPGGLP